ncbi:8-oxo-dGTP diphosphatase [Candidatus Pacearchaeota archaeon]|nr:8-oxo-dGTP diphosphatase [Candidatus Pacearchaeota archaeon]
MRTECVSILYKRPWVLLGLKKEGFGKGKYNGFGGGIEKGETLEEAAIRETYEEAGITIKNLERMGQIRFYFQGKEQDHLVNFFLASDFSGVAKETKEMKPEWFRRDKLPYYRMWEDDRYWLPLLLEGKYFTGKFNFNKKNLISKLKLNILDKL